MLRLWTNIKSMLRVFMIYKRPPTWYICWAPLVIHLVRPLLLSATHGSTGHRVVRRAPRRGAAQRRDLRHGEGAGRHRPQGDGDDDVVVWVMVTVVGE